MQANRRRFLNWLLGTSGGALAASALYPVARFISPPRVPEASTNQVNAGPANDPELLEKGFKIVRFGNEPVILVDAGGGDYRAFAATCTHLDCIVEFRPQQKVIWCNCHNGVYDLNGRNVAGPPPRPLEVFTVHVVEQAGQASQLVVERA
jgi:cytochrome b6-f complex iron-sulfur subunit